MPEEHNQKLTFCSCIRRSSFIVARSIAVDFSILSESVTEDICAFWSLIKACRALYRSAGAVHDRIEIFSGDFL